MKECRIKTRKAGIKEKKKKQGDEGRPPAEGDNEQNLRKGSPGRSGQTQPSGRPQVQTGWGLRDLPGGGGGLGGNGLQEARAGGRGQDASWLPQGRWEPMEGSEPRGRGKPSSDQG